MILSCGQSGGHPENNLAKFGYMLELIIKSGDLHLFVFEIWRIWVFFSMKNPLYMSKSYFSSQNLLKIHQ